MNYLHVASYLGKCAETPPSVEASKAIRSALLSTELKNPSDAGAMASERNVPGKFPDAYAVYHKIVTQDEMVPRWNTWISQESARGLGHGGPYLPGHGTYEVLHFTVVQHWMIGMMHPEARQAKLSRQQAVELRNLLVKDKIVTATEWLGASRGLGWCAQGLLLDYMLLSDMTALAGALAILARVHKAADTVDGIPFIWRNYAATNDPNHKYTCSPWMDSTFGMALTMLPGQDTESKKLIMHWLDCVDYSWDVSDYGWDKNGATGFNVNPLDATRHWIWPALIAAKHELGAEFPKASNGTINDARLEWEYMNSMRPGDSGFKDMRNMSVAIACAPEWGWRK